MKLLPSLTAAVTVLLALSCLSEVRKRRDWNRGAVHLPFLLAGIGMVGGGFFSVLSFLVPMEEAWEKVCFCLLALISDSLMVAYRNCVIRYDSRGFTARNFFGITRQCDYARVEGIRAGHDSRVYFDGHGILVDVTAVGGGAFLMTLAQRYRQITGKPLPQNTSYRRWLDPMNGHVDYPWVYFGLFALLGAFCAGLPFLMHYSMNHAADPAELSCQQVQFQRYEVDDGVLKLYAEGVERPFQIDYYLLYGDAIPQPVELCRGDSYTVGIRNDFQWIESMTGPDGTAHITPESARAVYRQSQRLAVWILNLLCPLGVLFSWFAIAVARHPERYPDRFRRLFYKDGFLH